MELKEIRQTDYESLYDNDILYKYIDWSDDLKQRILTHFEIYFTDPEEFGNDENHRFPIDFDSVTNEEIIQRAKELSDVKNQIFNEETQKQIIKNYRNSIKDWFNKDKAERKNGLGIFCLSTKRDLPEMWEMFAGFFKGICVGFNATELFKQSGASGGGMVNYFLNPPELPQPLLDENLDIASILIETISLPSNFEQENEYRLFKTHVYGSFRKQILNKDAYCEIIIGSEMDSIDKEYVLKLLKERLPNAKIYTALFNKTLKKVEIIETSN